MAASYRPALLPSKLAAAATPAAGLHLGHTVASRCRPCNRRAILVPRAASELVDAIAWPEGARPKRGRITKGALAKLKVPELKAELSVRSQDVSGSKAELIDRLLAALHATQPQTADGSDDDTAEEQPVAGPGPSSQAAAAAAMAARSNGHGTSRAGKTQRTAPPAAHQALAPMAEGPAAAGIGAAGSAAALDVNGHAHVQVSASTAATGLNGHAVALQGMPNGTSMHVIGASTAAVMAQAGGIGATNTKQGSSRDRPAAAIPAASSAANPALQQAAAAAAAAAAAGGGSAAAGAASAAEDADVAALRALGFDPAAVPPFPPTGRVGAVFSDAELGLESPEEEKVALLANNRSDMLLTFLGTSAGNGSRTCNAPSLALVRGKDTWLFDAGEDTQRQLHKAHHVKPMKIVRLFISARAPERMLGLPGMLCTLGNARERGHENADIPVHVFGPSGVAEFLATVFQVSDTYLECPIIVHEFALGPVDPEDIEPSLYNRRAKIYRAQMPPDQLNPDGWIDAGLDRFMPTQGRAVREKGSRAAGGVLKHDARAGFTQLPLPPPGDPTAKVHPSDMTWTLRVDVQATVTAALLAAGEQQGAREGPAWGFVVQEAARQGNLCVERARALGLRNRRVYASLKDGHPIENDVGTPIPPSLVVSPDKPGRRVAILPLPCASATLEHLSHGADVLVAGFGDAASAAELSARVRARNVVVSGLDLAQLLVPRLSAGSCSAAARVGDDGDADVAGDAATSNRATHIQPGSGHGPEDGGDVEHLLSVVQQALPSDGRAFAAHDLTTIILDKHEGTAPVDLAAAIQDYVQLGLQGHTPKLTEAEKAVQNEQRQARWDSRGQRRGGRGGRGGGRRGGYGRAR